MYKNFLILLVLLLVSIADGAVVVIHRGTQPHIFEFAGYTDRNFDINADGISDYRFTSDGSLIAALQSYGENRFISTLAASPDLGGYVAPVIAGSILGSDTSLLLGSWYRHTDNRGGSGFGLNFGPMAMQYQNAYIGAEFKIDGLTHYGWIQFEGYGHPDVLIPVYDKAGNLVTYVNIPIILGGRISSWGYETVPGKSIVVGAVPEPSSSLFVAACAAISCLRRKRNTF